MSRLRTLRLAGLSILASLTFTSVQALEAAEYTAAPEAVGVYNEASSQVDAASSFGVELAPGRSQASQPGFAAMADAVLQSEACPTVLDPVALDTARPYLYIASTFTIWNPHPT